ncbi:DHH family phosphoesterase [Candidatus Saccharibacteria bacterium]|nr:DHH family phosphoesterase [Candidatus Saccharibacteria bacterium]
MNMEKIKQEAKQLAEIVKESRNVTVIQAENPDADSLGTALALENILTDLGKEVSLYCAVDMPQHMHYIVGWERIKKIIPNKTDLLILVDNSSSSPMEKAIVHINETFAGSWPKFVIIDHHDTVDVIPNTTLHINHNKSVATSEVLYHIVKANDWPISPETAKVMAISILSDSLGLTSIKTTAGTYRIMADLVENHELNVAKLDHERKQSMGKTVEIVNYKAKLLQRVEYFFDNTLAIINIPYEEIKQYSDKYNPSVLVTEELRFADPVEMIIALKEYPDRITGALRSDKAQVCNLIAESFGGGGHPFAAGFKTRDWNRADLQKEILKLFIEKKAEKQKEEDETL